MYVTVTDPWGAAAIVVDEFPTCCRDPDRDGIRRRHLLDRQRHLNSKADGSSPATIRNGVYFEVMHFASEADKDAYLERDWADAPTIVTWNIDGVDKGKLYRPRTTRPKLPYIITTFTDPERAATTCCTSTGRTTR